MDPNLKLQIVFPESNQDHRLQLVAINGVVFAIMYSPLESEGPIHLNCTEWSLILLAPIKSKTNVLISAANIVCLSEVVSEAGSVNVHASKMLVKLTRSVEGEKVCEMGEKGEFVLDDPGALMYCYRLFEKIVEGARNEKLIADAQHQFISGLCTLAARAHKTENLDMKKVLEFWDIPKKTPKK
jgi:hypothetical protein